MKQFTISFFTFLLVAVISVSFSFSVYADEIIIEREQTVSIPAEKIWGFESDDSFSSNYNLQSNEESFLFYDQLDANNKAAYDVMKSWLKPRTDTLTVVLPSPVSFTTTSLDMSSWSEEQSEAFWEVVGSCVKDGKTALTLDYPELFWFDEDNISISISYSTSYNFMRRNYTIKITKIYLTAPVSEIYEDTQKAAEYIDLLTESIDNFEIEGDDYYTKIKFIHDYVANKVTYNLKAPYRSTALGVFIEPYEIVCEGYSEFVKLLCDRENIPCISVIGNIDTAKKTAHMWNYIQMEDGKWYGLDCTWDDLDDENNPVKYQYFLTGAKSFLANHTEDKLYITANFTYPELSETDYVYDQGSIAVTTAASTTVQTTTVTTASTAASTTEAPITSSTTTSTVSDITTTPTPTVTTGPATSGTTILKGDFNNNNKLDIGDAVLLQKKLVKLADIEKKDFLYELNGDKTLNVWDFIILKKLLLVNK